MSPLYTQKTRKEAFIAFKKQYPNWEESFGISDSEGSSTYKRIALVWEENQTLTHIYNALINVKTGEIYTDCSRKKIWVKQGCAIIGRPIHTLLKTAWHASLIAPAIWEAYKVFKGGQTKMEGLKNFGHSVVDIIRTPLYGLALTVGHVAAFIFGAIYPSSIYTMREQLGSLERQLYRINRLQKSQDYELLTPCFSPVRNISKELEQDQVAKISPTNPDVLERLIYERLNGTSPESELPPPEKEYIKEKLNDLGRRFVVAMRTHRNPFNRCCRLFPSHSIPYITASYKAV